MRIPREILSAISSSLYCRDVLADIDIDMSHFDGLIPHVDSLFQPHDGLFPRSGGLHPPSEVLLSWPKPNYINPEDRGWSSSIVVLVFLAVTFFVYIARMWARLGIGKNAGLDDTIMSIAMIPTFGLSICVVLGKSVFKLLMRS